MDKYISPFDITNEMLSKVSDIMKKLGIKSKETLRKNYIDTAIGKGLIKPTIPDKPTSKNQMYYKEI